MDSAQRAERALALRQGVNPDDLKRRPVGGGKKAAYLPSDTVRAEADAVWPQTFTSDSPSPAHRSAVRARELSR